MTQFLVFGLVPSRSIFLTFVYPTNQVVTLAIKLPMVMLTINPVPYAPIPQFSALHNDDDEQVALAKQVRAMPVLFRH